MPTRQEHLGRAANAETVAGLVENTCPEWAAIALFYAALHYVEAYFYVASRHTRGMQAHYQDHGDRAEAVNTFMRSQYRNYRRLEERSMAARYQNDTFTLQEVQDLRRERLEPIKQWIDDHLSPRRRR